jgi:hypothetical protein
VKPFYALIPLVCALAVAPGEELKTDTAAAFDRYVKLTEEGFAKRTAMNFLEIDQNQKQKNMVWLGQGVIEPHKTLDAGKEIDIPDGLLQDWIGTLYLDGETLAHVRDMVLNFADFKTYFKDQINDSKLIKRDGDHLESSLRFYKRQVTPIVLNTNFSTVLTAVDATHAYIANRSTHIGEAAHPNKKSTLSQERSPDEEVGYMWRLNFYWHIEQADDGVYAEFELISLSRPGGGMHPGRFLSGFESFPRQLAEGFLNGVQQAFAHHR